MSNKAVFDIQSGDYESAGEASKSLKDMLKKMGVDAKTVRRTMVAAYEAEMNVAIHSLGGTMEIALEPERVDVVVADRGPGISDIEKAMTEGFSTAPPEARAMGFGAGMGLPNIKKNSDTFSIESEAGKGTRLAFSINLKPRESAGQGRSYVRVRPERCRQCLQCLHVCPTRAMRVRGGRPIILEHLCVDCTSCAQVCPGRALALRCSNELPKQRDDMHVVLPAALFEQFGGEITPPRVIAALKQMGFRGVYTRDAWELALRRAVAEYTVEQGARQVISPVCSAVASLVQVWFPSLLGHVAPFLPPVLAAREELAGWPVLFVAACASQCSALMTHNIVARTDIVAPATLVTAAMPVVNDMMRAGCEPNSEPAPHNGVAVEPLSDPAHLKVLRASGMRHVMSVLEKIENGLLGDFDVLELYACEQGCFGSPMLTEDPFVAVQRWESYAEKYDVPAKAVRRITPLEPRLGVRLDEDMSKALEKLSKMDAIAKGLPGRDCGVCGAPTCCALAEDVVLGRTDKARCVYLRSKAGQDSRPIFEENSP